MQAAPAVAVEVKPDRVSRFALAGLAGASLAVTVVWAVQRGDGLGGAVLALVATSLMALLPGFLRTAVRQLRWDGQAWHLSAPDGQARPTAVGQLAVALDFGNWMLLRFQPDPLSTPAARQWLPLSRVAVGPSWHALRCAAHAPRPMPAPAPPAGPAF